MDSYIKKLNESVEEKFVTCVDSLSEGLVTTEIDQAALQRNVEGWMEDFRADVQQAA